MPPRNHPRRSREFGREDVIYPDQYYNNSHEPDDSAYGFDQEPASWRGLRSIEEEWGTTTEERHPPRYYNARAYLPQPHEYARERVVYPEFYYYNTREPDDRAYWSDQEPGPWRDTSSIDEEWEDETVELSPPASYHQRRPDASPARVRHRHSSRSSGARAASFALLQGLSSSDEEREIDTQERYPPVPDHRRRSDASPPRVRYRRSAHSSEILPSYPASGRGLSSVDEELENHIEEPRQTLRYHSQRHRRGSPPRMRYSHSATSSRSHRSHSAPSDCSSDITDFSGVYRYRSIGDDEIRLLRLEPASRESDDVCCSTITALRTQRPTYEALSYEWGSAERQKHIIMDGRKVRVRRNLWDALRALRVDSKRHPRVLWVDALCINQCDNVEKFQQVAQMGPIYRRARRAICWLGKASADSDLAIAFVKKAAIFCKNRTKELGCSNQEVLDLGDWITANDYFDSEAAANRLLDQRSYWNRMWIRQEIILAEEVTIHCGHSKLNWSEAEIVCKGLRTWNQVALQSGEKTLPGIYHVMNCLYRSRTVLGSPKGPRWLLTELLFSRWSGATDPKDKVFGLLGMFQHNAPPDSYRLQPNYGLSVFEVYLETFKYCVFTEDQKPRGPGCLDILCASRPEYSGSGPHQFPSWLADWSASQCRHPISSSLAVQNRGFPRASLDKAPKVTLHPDGQRLRCKGLCIGRVQVVGSPVDGMESERSLLATLRDWCNIACEAQKGKVDWDGFLRTVFFDAYGDPPPELRNHLAKWPSDSKKRLSTNIAEKVFRVLSIWLWRKFVFAVSNHGDFLGIPQEALPNDAVCIIYGCTVPVVLRLKEDDTYTFVGDCYVDGFMYGEAIKRLDRGHYQSRTFELK